MIELIFTVCLMADPRSCEKKALPPFVDVSVLQCVIGAQPVLARWAEAHPGYRVTGWTCRDALEVAEEA